jgi:hypothetical protein
MKRFLLLCCTLAAGCVPPPATTDTTQAQPAAGGETASSGATCDSACAHLAECQLADAGECVAECQAKGYDQQIIDTVQAASCEQLAGVEAPPEEPAPTGGGGGGGGAVTCWAQGIYEVCDGTFCRDNTHQSMGAGATQDEAAFSARSSCDNHILSMIAIQSLNNTARGKGGCQVTSCN